MIKGSVIQFLLSQVRTSTEALIGGKVYFYQPGTTITTGIKIYLDEEATSPANNPYTLDADATAQIYASGKYRIIIKDASGVTQFDRDNVSFFDFLTSYEYDAILYGSNTFTQATIEAALTAIGTTNKTTLLLRPGTWVISSNADWSAYTNVTFKVAAGAIFSDTTNTFKITFSSGQIINQAWFGTTNAAMQFAARSLVAGQTWYLPNNTYVVTSKLNITSQVKIVGENINETVISSAVSGDYAVSIVQSGTIVQGAYTDISGLTIKGDGTAAVTSSGIGGLYIERVYWLVVKDINAYGFASNGYNVGTPGDVTTELRSGIYILDTAYTRIENCYTSLNDVGLRLNIVSQTVNTSISVRDVTSRQNRTHAALFNEVMTLSWDGGIIESNRGSVTMKIVNAGAYSATGMRFANQHWENNQVGITYPGAGSRDIYFDGKTYGSISLENLLNLKGEYAVELKNSLYTSIIGGFYGLTSGTAGPFYINNTCTNTLLSGVGVNSFAMIIDNGVNTKIIGSTIGLGASVTVPGTHFVGGKTVINFEAGGTGQTSFTGMNVGQVLMGIVPADGVLLTSAQNFELPGGSAAMGFGEGAVVWLYYTAGGKWKVVGYTERSTNAGVAGNTAQVTPLGDVMYVGDVSVTSIATLSSGFSTNNRRLTIISAHTGANTTTFSDGTGNLLLAGDFVMGAGDTLSLIYVEATNKWHETSRSAN